MSTTWQPFREPFRATVLRNVIIAVVLGTVLAILRGGLTHWPAAVLLMFWPTFGGHWIELAFLNGLRPRIPAARYFQVLARLIIWFVGGIALLYGMKLTAPALDNFGSQRWPAWWIGGLAFVGIELVAHLGLQLRGRPSFYNGRG